MSIERIDSAPRMSQIVVLGDTIMVVAAS